jgi:sec-independent protein translocase protein TatA
MGIESPVHLAFIAVVALIVLGPKRLPEVARALGHGLREFREAVGQQAEQPPAQQPFAQQPVLQQPMVSQPPVQRAVGVEPQAQPPSAPFVTEAEAASEAAVDPGESVRSGDAPDRGPL